MPKRAKPKKKGVAALITLCALLLLAAALTKLAADQKPQETPQNAVTPHKEKTTTNAQPKIETDKGMNQSSITLTQLIGRTDFIASFVSVGLVVILIQITATFMRRSI